MTHWFGIRHARWLWLGWKWAHWRWHGWRGGLECFGDTQDLARLNAIWRGEA